MSLSLNTKIQKKIYWNRFKINNVVLSVFVGIGECEVKGILCMLLHIFKRYFRSHNEKQIYFLFLRTHRLSDTLSTFVHSNTSKDRLNLTQILYVFFDPFKKRMAWQADVLKDH